MSDRQYPDGRWASGVGKAVHSLHGLSALLPPEGDTVWKNDAEKRTVPVRELSLDRENPFPIQAIDRAGMGEDYPCCCHQSTPF